MNTMKTMILAGAAALTLGMGAAMAQQTPAPQGYAAPSVTNQAPAPQAAYGGGSSDQGSHVGFNVGMPGHYVSPSYDPDNTGNGGE